jgi:hypothetical protein
MIMDIPNRFVTWCFSSISKQIQERFSVEKRDLEIGLWFEFMKDKDNKSPLLIEVRIDGPYFDSGKTSRDSYSCDLEVNLLVKSTLQKEDVYIHQHAVDVALQLICKPFKLFQLGYKDATGEYVGCLEWSRGRNTGPFVSSHGQVDPNSRIYQSTLEAHYTYNK